MACYDAVGKALGVPAHALMGRQVRQHVPFAYWSIDLPPQSELPRLSVSCRRVAGLSGLQIQAPSLVGSAGTDCAGRGGSPQRIQILARFQRTPTRGPSVPPDSESPG